MTCPWCLAGTPKHPYQVPRDPNDLHVIPVHDGVRFVECEDASMWQVIGAWPR